MRSLNRVFTSFSRKAFPAFGGLLLVLALASCMTTGTKRLIEQERAGLQAAKQEVEHLKSLLDQARASGSMTAQEVERLEATLQAALVARDAAKAALDAAKSKGDEEVAASWGQWGSVLEGFAGPSSAIPYVGAFAPIVLSMAAGYAKSKADKKNGAPA